MRRVFDARAALKGLVLKHDPAVQLPGFESAAKAEKTNQHSIKVLYCQPNLYCHYTANEIKRCGERQDGVRVYCGSASCAVCMRQFRRWYTNEFASLAEPFRTKKGRYGVVVTLIASGLVAPINELHQIDLLAIKRRVVRGFSRLGLDRPIIGGVDVSFNEEAGSRKPGHYQVHIAFGVLGHRSSKKARKRLQQTVSKCFRLEPSAFVRVKVRPLTNPVRQGSYLLKARFSKRLSFIAANGRRNTKKFPLKPKQLAEITMWFRQWQPLDRVLLHGVRVVRDHLVIATKKKARP